MAANPIASLFVKIGADIDEVKSALGQTENLLQGAAKGALTTAAAIGAGVTAIGVAAMGVMKVGLDTTVAWGESLDQLGDMFGMSGGDASKWTVAMKHVGLGVEEGAQQLNYFTRQLDNANAMTKKGIAIETPFTDALKKLGISTKDARGNLKSFDQIMPEIMDKFRKLPAGVNATALAMDLFGARGGSKFLDFLRQGSEGLDDASKKAKQYGLLMGTDTVDAIERLGFAQNDLNLALDGIKNQIGIAVLPIVQELVGYFNNNVTPAFTALEEYAPKITQAFKDIGGGIDWFGKNVVEPIISTLEKALKTGDWTPVKDAFWTWLTGKGGVINQVEWDFNEFLTAVNKWVYNENTKAQFHAFGESLGSAMVQGIKDLFGAKTTSDGIGASIVSSLQTAVAGIKDLIVQIGTGIGESISSGIFQALTGQQMSARLQGIGNSWSSALLQATLFGNAGQLSQLLSGNYNPWSNYNKPKGWYAGGLDTVISRPTVLGVGEAGAERVTVTPLNKQRNGASSATFNFYAPIYGVNDLQSAINGALDRRDRGLR